MVSDYVMTTEQLEEQVRTLRKVFDVVRFLDPSATPTCPMWTSPTSTSAT